MILYSLVYCSSSRQTHPAAYISYGLAAPTGLLGEKTLLIRHWTSANDAGSLGDPSRMPCVRWSSHVRSGAGSCLPDAQGVVNGRRGRTISTEGGAWYFGAVRLWMPGRVGVSVVVNADGGNEGG